MKKQLTTLIISCISIIAFGQQVPKNATLVIKYNGSRFDESLPLEKTNQYKFIQNMVQKEMDYKGIFPLDRTGIDFTKTTLQYAIVSDSSMGFITEVEISNLPDFLELVKKNYPADIHPTRQSGFEYLKISDYKYLGWNDKTAILAYAHSTGEKYEYYYPSAEVTDSVNQVVDSIIDARRQSNNYIEDKPVTEKKKKKNDPDDYVIAPPAVQWDTEEEDLRYDLQDSINAILSDKWYKDRDSVKAVTRRAQAISALANAFDKTNSVPVSTLPGYNNVAEPSAHVNVWMNYGSLYNQVLMQAMSMGSYGYYGTPYSLSRLTGKASAESGYVFGFNLFFEKEQIRVNQLSWAPNTDLAKMSKKIYKSRQSRSLAGYINPGHLGYLSVSLHSESMIHYYYKMIKDYLNTMPFTAEYSDLVNLYVDLLEISIDEKAISELAPGNMMFVLHQLGSKEVNYTTYEYDDDFNPKEIIKQKTELAPDFTFSFATKRPDFMKKLVDIPVKYAEKGGYDYSATGDYYTLSLDEERNPVHKLYFGVKNDHVIVTSSKEVIENAFGNRSYTLSPETKKHVFSHNYAGHINTRQLLQAVGPELSTETNRKIRKLLEENLGNISMESRLKNGMAQTSYTMKIKGNHENSFQFLFNITDAIRGIMEAEKEAETALKIY